MPAATGTLTLNNGSANLFPGNPPADVAGYAPSLFYMGTIQVSGTATSMIAPYREWLARPVNGCTVTGTIDYALEVTYPAGLLYTPSSTAGFMQLQLTLPPVNAYRATLFREDQCSTPTVPATTMTSGGGGTLVFPGAGSLVIPAGGYTYVIEIAH